MVPMVRQRMEQIFNQPNQQVKFHEPTRAVALGAVRAYDPNLKHELTKKFGDENDDKVAHLREQKRSVQSTFVNGIT